MWVSGKYKCISFTWPHDGCGSNQKVYKPDMLILVKWLYKWGSTNISVITANQVEVDNACLVFWVGFFFFFFFLINFTWNRQEEQAHWKVFPKHRPGSGQRPIGPQHSWHNYFHRRDIQNVLLTSKSSPTRIGKGEWDFKKVEFLCSDISDISCLNRGWKNTGVWVSKNHCSLPITCTLKHNFFEAYF